MVLESTMRRSFWAPNWRGASIPTLLGVGRNAIGPIFLKALEDNRERWPLFLPVFFGLGITVYFSLPSEPRSAPILFVLTVSALITAVSTTKGAGSFARAALVMTVFLSGLAWAQERTLSRETVFLDRTRVISGLEGRVAWVEQFEAGPRIFLADLRYWPEYAGQPPPQIRLRLKKGAVPEVGDWIAVTARISSPSRPSYPGGYDFARRAWFQEIGAVGFSLSSWEKVHSHSQESGEPIERFWRFVNRTRRDIIEYVRETDTGVTGAVLAALLTGDRSGIPGSVIEDLRVSGLAHLLAISGLHLGLVAGTVFFAVRGAFLLNSRWSLAWPTKKIAACAALIFALLYLFLAGATVPTQRAFLMTAIVLIAVLCDRQAISMRLVSIAAGVVLLLAPESLIGPSFQLSFAAVAALVAVYEVRAKGNSRGDSPLARVRRYALIVMLTTVIAGLATAPFAIHHFGRVAHYSVLANLLAVPIVTFLVMPLGLLALILMPLGLAEGPLALAAFALQGVLFVAESVSDLPGATGLLPAFPSWGFGMIVIGGLWWVLLRGGLRHIGAILVLAGGMSQYAVTTPIIILHETGRQAGLVWQDQLWIEAPRREKFAQRVWSEKLALPIAGSWEDLEQFENSPLKCGPLGCLFQANQMTRVAFSADPRGIPEDCTMASVIRLPIYPHPSLCRDSETFSPSRLRRGGAAVLTMHNGEWRIEQVSDARGDRPWTR